MIFSFFFLFFLFFLLLNFFSFSSFFPFFLHFLNFHPKTGSFFFDELENLRYMDRSHEFLLFYHEIIDYSQSLPLILQNLPKIVRSMLKKLDSKLLRAQIFQLFPPLFRDCQGEIFELFTQEILQKLLVFLDIKEAQILEEVFVVFAYALKYLFSKISANFSSFFTVFFYELFGNSNKLIRKFAAESFSFILKKLNKGELMRKMEIMLEIVQKLDFCEFEKNFDCLAEVLYESSKINSLNSYTLSYKCAEIYETFWTLIVEKYTENNNILLLFYNFLKIIIAKTAFSAKNNEKNAVKTYDLTDFFASLCGNFQGSLSEKLAEIIVKIFLFTVSAQNGAKNNAKILDLQLDVLLRISTGRNLEKVAKITMIFLGKVCKYAFPILSLSSIEKLERILFENSAKNEKNGVFFIIGLVYSEVFEEKAEEKNEENEFFSILSRKYTVAQKVYEYCVILLLKAFSFEEIISENAEKEDLLRFYLFFMVHKYSNGDKTIEFTDEATRTLLSESIVKLRNFFAFADESAVLENFLKVLLAIKIVKIVDFEGKNKEEIAEIFATSCDFIDKILEKTHGFFSEKTQFLPEIYALPHEFLEFYRFDPISLDLQAISFRKSLILLKTEMFRTLFSRKALGASSDFQEKFIGIYAKIRSELFLLKNLRKNLAILKNLSEILTGFFEEIVLKKIHWSVFEGISARNKLKIVDFCEIFQVLCENLTSNYAEIRLYSLKILEFFEVFPMEDANKGKETIFVGECEIVPLLLHVSYRL